MLGVGRAFAWVVCRRRQMFGNTRPFAVVAVALLSGVLGCSTAAVKIQARRLPKHEIEGIKRVAVMDLDEGNVRGFRGAAFSALLSEAIISQGHYTVVEKDYRDKILAEQGFQQTAVADENSAVEVGKILGAQGLIFGRLDTATVRREEGWRMQMVPGPGGTMRREQLPTVAKQATLSVTLRMVNVKTGQLVASMNKSDTQKAPMFGSAVGMAAISRLPSDEEMLRALAARAVKYFVPMVSPTYYPAKRWAMKGASEAARKSYSLIQIGAWKVAMSTLSKAIEQGTEDAAVYNNFAICCEQTKRFDDAETAYNKAIELGPQDGTIRRNYKEFVQGSKYREPKEKNPLIMPFDAVASAFGAFLNLLAQSRAQSGGQ